MADTHDTVEAYVAALEGDARELTEEIRRRVLAAAPDVTESIRYQMPCFRFGDEYLVHVAAWKKHVGLYPIPRFDDDLEAAVAPYRSGADTVQVRYRDPMPSDLLHRVLAALVSHRRPGAPDALDAPNAPGGPAPAM